jgi:hypothetical protein
VHCEAERKKEAMKQAAGALAPPARADDHDNENKENQDNKLSNNPPKIIRSGYGNDVGVRYSAGQRSRGAPPEARQTFLHQ